MTIKELMGTDLAGEASLSNAGLSGDPQKEIADEKNAFEKLPRQTPWIDKDKEKAANRIRERAGLVAPNHSLDELIKDLEGVEYKSAALAQLSECIKMTAPPAGCHPRRQPLRHPLPKGRAGRTGMVCGRQAPRRR